MFIKRSVLVPVIIRLYLHLVVYVINVSRIQRSKPVLGGCASELGPETKTERSGAMPCFITKIIYCRETQPYWGFDFQKGILIISIVDSLRSWFESFIDSLFMPLLLLADSKWRLIVNDLLSDPRFPQPDWLIKKYPIKWVNILLSLMLCSGVQQLEWLLSRGCVTHIQETTEMDWLRNMSHEWNIPQACV